MNACAPVHRIVCHLRAFTRFAVVPLIFVSCATKPSGPAVSLPFCRYTSSSRVDRLGIPTKVYVFPALLSDAKGKPKEKLTARSDPSGKITDWSASSSKSKLIRGRLERNLQALGYQIVSFQDVLSMPVPHSILMVSSFYTAAQQVDQPTKGKPDKYILTMIKANTFGLDLDPGKSKNLANMDGATFFSSNQNISDLEEESLSTLINWLGEEVSGMVYLNP